MTPKEKSKVLNDVLNADTFLVITPDSLHYQATQNELSALFGAALENDKRFADALEITWRIWTEDKIRMQ